MKDAPASYGVTNATDAAADAAVALALEELDRLGFTIVADAVAADLLAGMRDALDRVLRAQTERFGETELGQIGDSGTARALIDEDDVFLALLCLPRLDPIIEALLGPAAIVMQQNGIVIPGNALEHGQQSWHRDLPYQSWVASRPLALSALLAIDDFTEANGATLLLPGSHRHAEFPSGGFIERRQQPALMAAGSIVLFDAMLYHRGGVNRSASPRRAVNTVFSVPLLAQQIAFRARPDLDARLRRRLGSDYVPAASADEWRRRRLARLAGRGA